MYNLLMRAGYVSGLTMVPVPRNKNYTQTGANTVTVEYFKNLINAKSTDASEMQ